MNKDMRIRNSTADFLTFAAQNEGNSIEVRFEDDTLWLTQQLMADLFQTSRTNIVEHIRNIYRDQELTEPATCRNFRQVRLEGNREVCRELPYYNHAENEFEKYRVVQDRLFQSDFDKQLGLFDAEKDDEDKSQLGKIFVASLPEDLT